MTLERIPQKNNSMLKAGGRVMAERKMVNPQRISDQCGAHIIKRITCGWDGADYKTTLYKRINGGVGRLCDCAGYTHKRKCYHLPALEKWARDSAQKSKEQGK